MKKNFLSYFFIIVGSLLYAVGTVFFIFPNGLILGGTSGISIILTFWIPSTPGFILTIINVLLIVLAFIVLGKDMAIKTLVGSLLTTAFIALIEYFFPLASPIINNNYLSAVVGSAILAIASGILFFVNSSGGGTDIIALIVKKYAKINIGKALLVTDLLIVIVGGILSGLNIAISSFIGLLIKTLGIDLVIYLIILYKNKKEK